MQPSKHLQMHLLAFESRIDMLILLDTEIIGM
jgi:hypothetical protein